MSGYIGTQPVPQATQTRDSFTATASQTSFSTGGYSPGFLDVFLNGVKLAAADYTATNGSDVVLAVGAALNDIIETVAYTTFEVSTNASLAQGALADTALQPTGDGSGLINLPPSHDPVAVTGATPSLDVGSYNFFDSGTLTANTTVSFASVPTNARWSYSFKPTLVSGQWDVTTAVYIQEFSTAFQDTTPQAVFFKSDGTKVYVLGGIGDDVYEYDLSTAWDLSTVSYLQNFSVATQETNPNGIFFKPDGTKMYVLGASGDDVNEYDLSTAWDISTATYLQLFSVSTEDTSPRGIFFKDDGLKMYAVGDIGDAVYEYDLSTAWDISTASYLQNFSVFTQETSPTGLSFKPDGTKMYVVGQTSAGVSEYDLSTAWDLSTASFLQLFSVAFQDTDPQAVFFKTDGTKMYVAGNSGNDILEYNLGTTSTVTLPAAVENTPAQTLTPDTRVTYEFTTADAGTTVTLIGEEVI